MKPRARVTIGAAVLVAALVAALVATHWGTVCDHVEAWHFQVTRQTNTIEPGAEVTVYADWWEVLLQVAADASRSSVIFDHQEEFPLLSQLIYEDPDTVVVPEHTQEIIAFFQKNGFRILEQRVPRRAYVVIRYKPLPVQTPEAPQQFRGASTTVELKVAPGSPRSRFTE